jgi:thiol:disulfide interchange protein
MSIQFSMSRSFLYSSFLALLFILSLGPASLAQLRQEVTFTHQVLPAGGYKVGDVVKVQFTAVVNSGYYIYSTVPPTGGGNLPTTLKLDPETQGAELSGKLIDAIPPKKKYDDVFETDIRYFEKQAVYTQSVKITGPVVQLVGFVDYQYCNENSCIPAKYEFDIILKARGAAATPSVKQTAEPPTPNTTLGTQPSDSLVVSADSNKPAPAYTGDPFAVTLNYTKAGSAQGNGTSLWVTFFTALAFGFVALLTPCVYPMIPLTVSIFTKQATNKAQGRRSAFIYALSIIVIYVVFGLLITRIFGAETLYALSSNPWVNLVFFFVVTLFGLSFLGWFEIGLPSSWANFFDRRTRTADGDTKQGLLPVFFMAFTLVIVSFSCTGPLVGTVLINAAGGQFLQPTVGMLGFALAFAIPFGLLALFPSWLQRLPKSGGWMNSVKVVLGFLELALALKFLSNADLVWGLGILDREIYLGGWIVLGLLLGMYLLGKLRLPHDFKPLEMIPIPRLMAAIAVLWFVVYMVTGLWGAPLKFLSGFLPPVNNEMGVLVRGAEPPCALPADRKYASTLAEHTPPGFCAFYDLEEGLAYARSVNKPVFIDFTGHTCVNCRQMESNVWPDSRVTSILQEDYVLVQLYVDDATPLAKTEIAPDGSKLRTVGDKWLYFQRAAFATNAQPYYVLMDSDRNVNVPPRAYNLDVEAYLKFLQEGRAAYEK